MFQRVFLGVGLAMAIGTHAWAAPRCTDISTVWTLSSTFVDQVTSTGIYSDGATYVDGTHGVSASIKCGTNDAVLIVSLTRQIMLNFSTFLGASYSPPPSWTSGGPFASTPSSVKNCGGSPCTVLNIRNILDGGNAPRDQEYHRYTKLVSGFVAPDQQRYSLRMENPSTSGVALDPNDPTANYPYLNARVFVHHYPASQMQTGKETWFVYPELPTSMGSQSPSPENGVLLGNGVNYGQFTMPFYFTIEAQ